MKQVVIMPGGFHPFHAGHYALYKQAQDAFPGADVYVAATNDTSARPFPFAVKEKLAKLAGVAPGHFVQVKSPFQAREITANLDPENTQLIFVRSEKDANKPPQAGGVKKDGNPAYLQPLEGQSDLAPMNRHAYMAYLPTVEFGPGMTSATEIRTAWPRLNEKRKTALVMSLYPKTQTNPALAANVVKMLDAAMGSELAEGEVVQFPKKHRGDISDMHTCPKCGGDTQGGKYMGHQVQVCIPCKQVYLPPNSGIDQQGNKIKEAGFDREEFRRHMKDLEAREELRKTDPVAAKALDLRGQLPQQSKKKPEDDSMSINDPRHPGYAYTQAGQHKLDEFAPDGFDGFEDDNRVPMHFVVEKELYNRRSKWKKSRDADGVILFATKQQAIQAAEKFNKLDKNREFKYGGTQMADANLDEQRLSEFAPDEGGGARKFIPWPEFIEQVKQIVSKDFDCVENVVKTTIKARFVPHDPMEYGPTMLYSYYETRAGGRNKGAISTRGAIQVGKYTGGGFTGQIKGKLLTTFSLLKGHPFERHFDLTFDNIYKVANIILGNTQGALEFKPEGVVEAVDIGQEWMSDTELDQYVPDHLQQQWRELLGYDRNGNPSALWANLTGGYEPDVRDPQHRSLMVKVANKWFAAKKIPNVTFFNVRDADDELEWLVQIGPHSVAEGQTGPVEAYGYVYDRRDQRVMWRKTFPSAEAAYAWADSKNATVLGTRPVEQTVDEDYVDEKY